MQRVGNRPVPPFTLELTWMLEFKRGEDEISPSATELEHFQIRTGRLRYNKKLGMIDWVLLQSAYLLPWVNNLRDASASSSESIVRLSTNKKTLPDSVDLSLYRYLIIALIYWVFLNEVFLWTLPIYK